MKDNTYMLRARGINGEGGGIWYHNSHNAFPTTRTFILETACQSCYKLNLAFACDVQRFAPRHSVRWPYSPNTKHSNAVAIWSIAADSKQGQAYQHTQNLFLWVYTESFDSGKTTIANPYSVSIMTMCIFSWQFCMLPGHIVYWQEIS